MEIDVFFRIAIYFIASVYCVRHHAWLGWSLTIFLMSTNYVISNFPWTSNYLRNIGAVLITAFIIKSVRTKNDSSS